MKNKKSFTLIETIIVVAVIGLILPALFAIIFAILQEQTKIYRLSEVRRQGDYVLSVMGDVIRANAQKIYSNQTLVTPQCAAANSSFNSASGTDLFFKDRDGNWFQFVLSGDKIASGSSLPNANSNLTTTKTKVVSFNVSCSRKGSFSAPVVNIAFTISYATTSTRSEDTAQLSYQTAFKLRTF